MELSFVQIGTYRETVYVNVPDDEVNEKILELKADGYSEEEIQDKIEDWITDNRWNFDTDYGDTDYEGVDDWEWDDDFCRNIDDRVADVLGDEDKPTTIGEM